MGQKVKKVLDWVTNNKLALIIGVGTGFVINQSVNISRRIYIHRSSEAELSEYFKLYRESPEEYYLKCKELAEFAIKHNM